MGGRGKASPIQQTAPPVSLALWQMMVLASHETAWGKDTPQWEDDEWALAAQSLNHAALMSNCDTPQITPAQLTASLFAPASDNTATASEPASVPATTVPLALSATLSPDHQTALAATLAAVPPHTTQWGSQTYWQTIALTVNLLDPDVPPITPTDALTYSLAHTHTHADTVTLTLPDSPYMTVTAGGDSPLWPGATVPAALFASIAAAVEAEGGEAPTGMGIAAPPPPDKIDYTIGLFQPTPLPSWTQADFAHVADQIDSDAHSVAASLVVPLPPLPDWTVAQSLSLQHQTTLKPMLTLHPTLADYALLAPTLGSDATGQPITTGAVADALHSVPSTLHISPHAFLAAVAHAGFRVPELVTENDLDLWVADHTLTDGLTELDDEAWDDLAHILQTDGVTLQTAVLGKASQNAGLTLANKYILDTMKDTLGDWTLSDFADLAQSLNVTNHAAHAVTPQMIASYANVEPQIGGMRLQSFADALDAVGWSFENVDESFLPYLDGWVADHTTPDGGTMLPLDAAGWTGLAAALTEGDIGGAELKTRVLGTGTSLPIVNTFDDLLDFTVGLASDPFDTAEYDPSRWQGDPQTRAAPFMEANRLDFGTHQNVAHEWGCAFTGEWMRGLTSEQRESIGIYTTPAYHDINDQLLDKKPKTSRIQTIIAQIDAALARAPHLDHTLITYRYERRNRATDLKNRYASGNLRVGDDLPYPNFISTTLSRDSWAAGHFDGGIRYEITLQPGTPISYIGGISTLPIERELLLRHGGVLHVDGITRYEAGDLFIRATYVPKGGNDERR